MLAITFEITGSNCLGLTWKDLLIQATFEAILGDDKSDMQSTKV